MKLQEVARADAVRIDRAGVVKLVRGRAKRGWSEMASSDGSSLNAIDAYLPPYGGAFTVQIATIRRPRATLTPYR